MALSDLSPGYRYSASLLRERIASLRRLLKHTNDPDEIFKLKYRIAELSPLLTEMNMLSDLTEHYYEGGYYRTEKYCFQKSRRHQSYPSTGTVQITGTGDDANEPKTTVIL